mgnify:CR=1 FL=1
MAMTQQQYLANRANDCPNCGSSNFEDVDYHWANASDVEFVIDQSCNNCYAEWQVIAKVQEYRNLETATWRTLR